MLRPEDGPAPEGWGHVGYPVDWFAVVERIERGLPAYAPADPVFIDQRAYRAFARDRGANSA